MTSRGYTFWILRSDTYNTPFLPQGVRLFPGYGRMQGLVHRADDPLFAGCTPAEAVDRAVARSSCLMVNRNRGSGTRCLLDGLLAGRRPPGFAVEVRSHNAVAAAVSQGRADWAWPSSPWPVPTGWHSCRCVPSGMISQFPPTAGIAPLLWPSAGSGRNPRPEAGSSSLASCPAGRETDLDHRSIDSVRWREPADGPTQGLASLRSRANASARGAAGIDRGRTDRSGRCADQELPELPESVRVARDPLRGRGPLQGLAAGLTSLPEEIELAYATATDVPFLQPAWIDRLAALIGEHDLAIPRCDGFLHPLAASTGERLCCQPAKHC